MMEAASRAEFHRLVGMYGTGYRSRLREVWFRLSLRTTLTLSGQRLETRRLYRHVKDRLRALAEPTPGAAARERREGAGGTLVQ